MVRVKSVFCPEMARVGLEPPFASLANAATCGWATQLLTRISSRFESKAMVCGLPIIGEGASRGPLRITRFGVTLPDASMGNTVAEWLPKFDTHSSLFLRSTAIPVGFLIIVLVPF